MKGTPATGANLKGEPLCPLTPKSLVHSRGKHAQASHRELCRCSLMPHSVSVGRRVSKVSGTVHPPPLPGLCCDWCSPLPRSRRGGGNEWVRRIQNNFPHLPNSSPRAEKYLAKSLVQICIRFLLLAFSTRWHP